MKFSDKRRRISFCQIKLGQWTVLPARRSEQGKTAGIPLLIFFRGVLNLKHAAHFRDGLQPAGNSPLNNPELFPFDADLRAGDSEVRNSETLNEYRISSQ